MRKISWKAEKKLLITGEILFLISGLLILTSRHQKRHLQNLLGSIPHRDTLYSYAALGIVIALFTLLAIVTRI